MKYEIVHIQSWILVAHYNLDKQSGMNLDALCNLDKTMHINVFTEVYAICMGHASDSFNVLIFSWWRTIVVWE